MDPSFLFFAILLILLFSYCIINYKRGFRFLGDVWFLIEEFLRTHLQKSYPEEPICYTIERDGILFGTKFPTDDMPPISEIHHLDFIGGEEPIRFAVDGVLQTEKMEHCPRCGNAFEYSDTLWVEELEYPPPQYERPYPPNVKLTKFHQCWDCYSGIITQYDTTMRGGPLGPR